MGRLPEADPKPPVGLLQSRPTPRPASERARPRMSRAIRYDGRSDQIQRLIDDGLGGPLAEERQP